MTFVAYNLPPSISASTAPLSRSVESERPIRLAEMRKASVSFVDGEAPSQENSDAASAVALAPAPGW
jgi:hypothetical protein